MKITVLLVDDHLDFRKGLRELLKEEQDIQVIGEAEDGREAIAQVRNLSPDIVIMDVTMPNLNGIDACRLMTTESPNIKIIALSVQAGKPFIEDMLNAGASGYILKENAPEELAEAIKTVKQGKVCLSDAIKGVVNLHDSMVEQADSYTPVTETIYTHIKRTKIHPPPVPFDIVIRTDLMKRLSDFHDRPLTLVSAPAGYGKSILVSSWLTECKIPAAWISLEVDDNHLRIFLEYIIATIQKIFPNNLNKTSELLKAAELPPFNTITNILLNDLDKIDDEFVLVLDDYHLIIENKIHDLLDEILRFPPEKMSFCIITRRDPPLKISSLRAYNKISEIRINDLAFNHNEIMMLYKNLLGFPISEEISESLLEKTEGWVAGLRLAALSIGTVEELEIIMKKVKGNFRLVTEFLIEEVLSKQPEDLQNYLIKTSLLDRFCAEVTEALYLPDLDKDEMKMKGSEFIEWLTTTNLFIIPLDDEQKWYRYHHEFQRLLQNQLKKQRTAEQIIEIHLRASNWFEAESLLDEAIKYAIAGEDLNKVADIIEVHGRTMMNNDKWFVVTQWQSKLPDEIIQKRPELLLLQCWKHYYHFEVAQIIPVIDKIDKIMDGDVWTHQFSGEVGFFRGYCLLFGNQIVPSLKYIKHALNIIPFSDVEFRVETEIIYGIAKQINNKSEEVICEIQKWLKDKPLHPLRETRLLLTLMFLHYTSGNMKKADQYIYEHRKIASLHKLHNGLAWSDYLSGLFNLQQGNIENAINLMEKAADLKYYNHTLAAVDNLATLTIAYEFNGQSDKAIDTIKTLNEFTNYLGQPFPYLAQSCAARISLMQNNTEAASEWLMYSQPNFSQVMIWWFDMPIITRCRVLIAEGSVVNLSRAEEELHEYTKLGNAQNNQLQLINIGILLSLVFWKQDKIEQCVEKLNETFAIAEPSGFIFPFLEPGKEMAELLRQITHNKEFDVFVKKILNYYDKKESRPSLLNAPSSGILVNQLSAREQEVLNYLSEGLRNKEIADKLFLAPETVKKHVANILQKLDVHSRMNAVRRAREMGF